MGVLQEECSAQGGELAMHGFALFGVDDEEACIGLSDETELDVGGEGVETTVVLNQTLKQ